MLNQKGHSMLYDDRRNCSGFKFVRKAVVVRYCSFFGGILRSMDEFNSPIRNTSYLELYASP